MRYLRSWIAMAGAGAIALAGRTAMAQSNGGTTTADNDPPTLEQRVERLDQEIRVLKRLRELEHDSAAAAAKERPAVTASKEGFSLKSADGKYSVRFRGYVQSDGRFYPSSEAVTATDNLLIRRVRPIVEATVGRYFEFRLMPDFGGTSPTIFDAYWDARFVPAFTVRAGKFKPPVGLERLQSATDIGFAERGLPTNLVPSRDIGLQVGGEIAAGIVSYQVGVFNGVPDLANGGDDLSDAKDFAGRVFLQPFRRGSLKGLGIGVGGSTGLERASPVATGLSAYRTPGQQAFFRYRADAITPANTVFANGRRTRVSPQGYFYTGSLGLLGEFALSQQEISRGAATARLQHTAWQASSSFFLTGEAAGFRSPTPKKPFDLKDGGWGAIELVARYGELRIDPDAFPTFANPASTARQAKALGIGVNWHFTRAVKLAVDYEHTAFTGGASTGDLGAENFVVGRFQHSF